MHLKHLCRASDGAGAGERAHRAGGHAAQRPVLTEHTRIRESRHPMLQSLKVAFELEVWFVAQDMFESKNKRNVCRIQKLKFLRWFWHARMQK